METGVCRHCGEQIKRVDGETRTVWMHDADPTDLYWYCRGTAFVAAPAVAGPVVDVPVDVPVDGPV